MKLKRFGVMAGAAITATLALAACGTNNNTTPPPAGGSGAPTTAAISCSTGSLTAQGSTAQKNAMDEWIKDYKAACSGANVDYQGTGSGAGITAQSLRGVSGLSSVAFRHALAWLGLRAEWHDRIAQAGLR